MAFLASISLLSSVGSAAYAQTEAQLRAEGAFVRALIKARDAKDCKAALRLIDERRVVLRREGAELARRTNTVKSHRDFMYLASQMEGLRNRRAVVARECRQRLTD